LNHKRYNGIIAFSGTAFSIIVPAVFAAMPIAMHIDGWLD
jgi:succinate dehydrogenase / fumarate reductase, cytochrome b subunit